MKRFISIFILIVVIIISCCIFIGCDVETIPGSIEDIRKTQEVADNIQANQPTPVDINYSLERYNLIKRAYWVNGQREKAMAVTCAIDRPLGYVILFTESGAVVGTFEVDGKVTSLNSYLTPDSEYYERGDRGDSNYTSPNSWLADVDGSYGTNDNGIFFFTPDGKYLEWTGTYLYSDIPFIVNNPVLTVKGD